METFERTESFIVLITEWLRLGIEVVGVILVVWGVILALWCYLPKLFSRKSYDFVPLRLMLARYLALALEFQLGADILTTAISPSWEAIGKLGAIAIIRTGLNYFLAKEMDKERELVQEGMIDEEDSTQ